MGLLNSEVGCTVKVTNQYRWTPLTQLFLIPRFGPESPFLGSCLTDIGTTHTRLVWSATVLVGRLSSPWFLISVYRSQSVLKKIEYLRHSRCQDVVKSVDRYSLSPEGHVNHQKVELSHRMRVGNDSTLTQPPRVMCP